MLLLVRLEGLQRAALAIMVLFMVPHPVHAASYSATFVDAFISACTPERTSYSKTVAHARTLGWVIVDKRSNAELAAVVERSEKGITEGKAEGYVSSHDMTIMSRVVAGRPLHLIVSLTRSTIFNQVGCYLYDFDATAPVDRAEVTRALAIQPANMIDSPQIVTTVWGPSPKYKRTLDTYLTFIPPGSPHVEKTGFDGTVLKFSVGAPKETGGE